MRLVSVASRCCMRRFNASAKSTFGLASRRRRRLLLRGRWMDLERLSPPPRRPPLSRSRSRSRARSSSALLLFLDVSGGGASEATPGRSAKRLSTSSSSWRFFASCCSCARFLEASASASIQRSCSSRSCAFRRARSSVRAASRGTRSCWLRAAGAALHVPPWASSARSRSARARLRSRSRSRSVRSDGFAVSLSSVRFSSSASLSGMSS
mmetsp:Transcript_85860/g.218865  ORF Transcript_85860/g.218865 Transcript_85860/m.218865 type:complete len:210 (+) Transcript_85860:275-904(+)